MEFSAFNHGIIEGKTPNEKQEIIRELHEFLLNETGVDWKISIKYQENIISIYDSMIDKLKKTDKWQKVQKYFPDSKISHISKKQ